MRLIWLPADSSSTRGGEISLSREAAPDCWEAPHPRPRPTRTPTLPVPLPPTWGFLFPGLRPSIGSLHLRYPLLLWGSRKAKGHVQAHTTSSQHSWWTGNGVEKKKRSSPTGSPPHTHILAMEGADTPNCRPPERSGSKTMVHISASPFTFVFWTRVQWLSLPWAKAMVRQALIHSLFPPLCPRPSLLFLNFYLFIYL